MKTQRRFFVAAAILLLIMSYSQMSSAQDQDTAIPIDSDSQPLERPLSTEASFFYDQLAPYGQWFWIDAYGWVWSPNNNVDTGWRPYTDGHWVYDDSGWTWVSDLEWGWAPFHYGRWFFHDHRGWCWVPGLEWAPAWVAWHWGDDWCGWAPMPPLIAWESRSDWDDVIPTFGWCFVDRRNFYDPHLKDHITLVARNITLLGATRNVTRFEIRDRGIVNLSITPEQVERATGHPVQRFRITEVNSPAGIRVPPKEKTGINIYRPVVRETKVINPIPHPAAMSSAQPAVTFEKPQRDEDAYRELAARQARERETLEQLHQSEFSAPPTGFSTQQLMERQQAERREFYNHVNRQNQVFVHRH